MMKIFSYIKAQNISQGIKSNLFSCFSFMKLYISVYWDGFYVCIWMLLKFILESKPPLILLGNENALVKHFFVILVSFISSLKRSLIYTAFRLASRSLHCCFDGDICSTAQAPVLARGKAKQQAVSCQWIDNLAILAQAQSDRRQTVDFYSTWKWCGSVKAKAAWLLRPVTLKRQALITRGSGNVASSKLVWHQLQKCKNIGNK